VILERIGRLVLSNVLIEIIMAAVRPIHPIKLPLAAVSTAEWEVLLPHSTIINLERRSQI